MSNAVPEGFSALPVKGFGSVGNFEELFASLEAGERVATISVTSDFMGVGKAGDWIEGEASIVRRGRSIGFTDARVRCVEKTIFMASGKWAISRP